MYPWLPANSKDRQLLPENDRLVEQVLSVLGESVARQLGIYHLPENFKLSVVMPVYNESATLHEILHRVQAVAIPKEIIIVDDGSADGTRAILRGLENQANMRIVYHERNMGKGAALQTAFAQATGDVVIIQDADLEYDPSEYPRLIQPIVDGRADVVYGSRFTGNVVRVHLFWHRIANGLLTFCSNIFTNLNLTDMETGYKVFRRSVLEGLTLREKRFGIEPELTAKIARQKCRIYEMPISYAGRNYSEGKKIALKDAFRALYCIVRYWAAN